MPVNLNFINQSDDLRRVNVVIFQKNVAVDSDGTAVAWRVIDSGRGESHPFIFPEEMYVGASDSFGNGTPQLKAKNGELFKVVQSASGHALVSAGPGTNSKEVQVLNALPSGVINANIYRDDRLLATKSSTSPQQHAMFQFKPAIWIGEISQIQPGDVLDSAIMSDVNTELSLVGVASGDIVMTGGGFGVNSEPFAFNLANIGKA